jgi:hypothetical protein
MRRGATAWVSAVLMLLGPPAAASAAAPANDAFADREVLIGSLPITESSSNLEATAEAEEPAPEQHRFGVTGHTVWYEWEATADGLVTVDTCGSAIRAVLGVYTGSAVEALDEVAGDFASAGPNCSGSKGEAVTFRAVSGVSYMIQVDAVLEIFGGGTGQGSFELEIAATPVPANDDFADAEVLAGEMLGPVYAAGGEGFTWNATKEPGEPQHAGNPGGASVWYSWDPPFSGVFTAQACGNFGKSLLAVYTGSSVSGLTPVAADDHSCSRAQFSASAGTTYRVAVDGQLDSGTGSALMGVISVNIVWEPSPPVEPIRESPFVELPGVETAIRKKVIRPKLRGVTFVFSSSEADSRFLCTLDKRPTTGCRSPRTYKNLSPGRHVFEVAAEGRLKGWDVSPATASFAIPRPKRKARP